MSVRARHVLCILHDDPKEIEAIVARYPGWEFDHEFSITTPDARMRKAFEACMDRVDPSMQPSDWEAIETHRAVAYMLSPRIEPAIVSPVPPTPGSAAAIAESALRIIGDAFSAGARAAKNDSCGIAHGAARWQHLVKMLREPPVEIPLHNAFVRRPIGDGTCVYTCGMHLLGRPDIELVDESDAVTMIRWLDGFAYHTLDLTGVPLALADGDTWRPDSKVPRRVLRQVACTRYPDDDFFHNPQGYWRIEKLDEANAKAQKPRKKVAAKKAKQPNAKKPAAKTTTARKPNAKKPAAKKPAAKKSAAKKRTATKPASKKPAAMQKPVAKRPVAKKR